jgi:exodeoxyribonuclease V gamma subunit
VLPPGQLGWRKANEIRQEAMQLAIAALTHRQVKPRAHDIEVDLGGGRRLTGTVTPVYGDRLVAVSYSRLAAKQLLESWIRLLALAANDPDHNWTALTIGRAPRGTTPERRLLGPAVDAPDVLLREILALYDAGRREPLPLPLKTSFAWASARFEEVDPREAALRKWRSRKYPAEDADPANVRVWGSGAPLETLLGPVRPDEAAEGEDTRLGAYSARLWLPLLRSERGVV